MIEAKWIIAGALVILMIFLKPIVYWIMNQYDKRRSVDEVNKRQKYLSWNEVDWNKIPWGKPKW